MGYKFIRYLAFLLAFLVSFNTMGVLKAQDYIGHNNNVIKADIDSRRIPSGTEIKVRIEDPVNSHNSFEGDLFVGTIIEDIKVNNYIILPAGTIVRGKVEYIKRNWFLNRGAEMTLLFDHIVTPVGKQIPVHAKISDYKFLDSDNGNLSAGGGYLKAVESHINRSSSLAVKCTDFGVKSGLSFGRGIPVVLTAPVAAAGGVALGGGLFFARSIKTLWTRGEDVRINPGDIMRIITLENIDIPVN